MLRLFTFFFRKLPVKASVADNQLYLLSEYEQKSLRKLEWLTLILSAAIGAVMVLVLYIPQYIFPNWFAEGAYTIPFTAIKFSLSVTSLVYGIVLVYIEILMLTALHLYCAHEIAVRTGLFRNTESKEQNSAAQLVLIGMEKKDKSLSLYGLDPFQGLSRTTVFLRNLLFSLKATLSNIVIKILVQRILGRYALRAVLDLLGIPIFAFWNAWASRRVLREARVVIMGENLLNELAKRLQGNFSPADHDLIYDALQYVAISKRDYHRNHSRLAALILNRFEIKHRSKHKLSSNFFDSLKTAPVNVQEICKLIIALGIVVDGYYSAREKRRVDQLNEIGILPFTSQIVKQWSEDFRQGRGINEMLSKFPHVIAA
ncbi:MAG: LBF_2804 family protein [Bacteroidia bacterium]